MCADSLVSRHVPPVCFAAAPDRLLALLNGEAVMSASVRPVSFVYPTAATAAVLRGGRRDGVRQAGADASGRIAQSVSGDKCGPRANHSVRPAADHPLRDEPAKTRRGTRRDRPGHVVLPDALGARANPGTKGTIGMTTRPSILAQDLSAVPAVRGNER
jgi:hypothetical protein